MLLALHILYPVVTKSYCCFSNTHYIQLLFLKGKNIAGDVFIKILYIILCNFFKVPCSYAHECGKEKKNNYNTVLSARINFFSVLA